MKLNKHIWFLTTFFCLNQAQNVIEDISISLSESTPNDKVPKEKIIVKDHHLYPYMASVQRSPGRQKFGYSATFIAENWVLNHIELLKELTPIPINPTKLVVVSHTVNARSRKGRIHRIRKIVEEPTTGIALLKVNGSVTNFAKMVSPRYKLSENEPLFVLAWNTLYLNTSLIQYTGIYYNSTLPDCKVFSKLYFCTEPVRLIYDQSLSPILNLYDELVGVLLDASAKTDDEEEFWSISYYGPILKELINKN